MEGPGRFSPLPYLELYEREAPGQAPTGRRASEPASGQQRRLFPSSPRGSRSLTDVSGRRPGPSRRQLRPEEDGDLALKAWRPGRPGCGLAWQPPGRAPAGSKDAPAPAPRGALALEPEASGDQWATAVDRGFGHGLSPSGSSEKSAPSRAPASAQEPRGKALGAGKEPEPVLDPKDQARLPARDKKIVGLMLERLNKAKRIQELQQQAAEAWEEVKRCNARFQVLLERERRQQLCRSREQWQRQKEERRARVGKEQQQRQRAWEKEMALRDGRWQRQVREQESRRREKLARAREQAATRKQRQEQRLGEQEPREPAGQAGPKRQPPPQSSEGPKKPPPPPPPESGLAAAASHQFRKVLLDSQHRAEDVLRRLALEQRCQRSGEVRRRRLEERQRQLKEKAQREEEHLLLAKWRAEETEEQRTLRKKVLAELAELKIQQARENVHKSIKDKAERIREFNFLREKNHHYLRQRAEEEAESHLEEVREAIRRKEQKMDRLSREKGASLQEARRTAQASLQLREKVRALRASFDSLAWEAQLGASPHRGSR
ncbi:coiled-coil domain-containing protein 185 [Macrotis lagotis]|uniref:coiled-coil domain-containing protein 185 n=1 Tax=Macrotis lagotis TaxID=92651 RepID=UPI003D6930E2